MFVKASIGDQVGKDWSGCILELFDCIVVGKNGWVMKVGDVVTSWLFALLPVCWNGSKLKCLLL